MRAMAAEGRLVPESHVRREVDQRWFNAGKIPGLLAGARPAATATATAPAASTATASAIAVADPLAAKATATNNGKSIDNRATANGNGHPATPMTTSSQRSGDDSSQKLEIARPMAPAANGAGPPAAGGDPPAPPPVKKRSGKPKAPLPEPAPSASPLGIVVAPPVAAPKGGKAAAKSPLAAAAEKDANGLSPLLVGGMLGGVALILVAVGVGVVAWQRWQSDDAQAARAAKAAAQPFEDKPAISEAELDAILGPIKPREPAPAAAAAPATNTSPPPEPTKAIAAADAGPADDASPLAKALADPKVEAARKLIAAQTRWTPVEGVVIRGRDIQVEVAQIWLASDEKGTRIDPVLPSSAPAATGPIAQALASATQRKYVFVDIRVSNGGAIPRKYTSWNTGGNITAILADSKGEPLPLVPPEKTPSVERLQTLHIPAGQMIGDILVFEAPDEPFESLKLLLSQGAFATAGRSFALEVPVEFLFKRVEGLPPQTALAADDASPAEGEGVEGKAAPKAVDPNAPPSLEEVTKQLELEKNMRDKQNATDDKPKNEPPGGGAQEQ